MEANNMAAMREALEMMSDLFAKGVICTSYANSSEEMEQIEELYRKVKAALSAPPRNCDVGTPEEQSRRLSEFCKSHGLLDGVPRCEKCRFLGADNCELAWAQMPYEEGGAK